MRVQLCPEHFATPSRKQNIFQGKRMIDPRLATTFTRWQQLACLCEKDVLFKLVEHMQLFIYLFMCPICCVPSKSVNSVTVITHRQRRMAIFSPFSDNIVRGIYSCQTRLDDTMAIVYGIIQNMLNIYNSVTCNSVTIHFVTEFQFSTPSRPNM